MEPDDLLCSRNARPPKALVGRAQWKLNQPPSLKREREKTPGTSPSSYNDLITSAGRSTSSRAPASSSQRRNLSS
jgi:hypothetical protein